jgi:GNAT superfamily N-acetyltransferase
MNDTAAEVKVRPLREDDLPAADHIMRLAFGTFLGLPEPAAFMGDAGYVRGRWYADPSAAFGAFSGAAPGGGLVGSNFATNWGTVGFFGPLTIHPDHWDRGVGRRLMEPVMECFARWKTSHAGLFTFASSPKHVGLYQKFGFWPRFLTAITSKPVAPSGETSGWTSFSGMAEGDRAVALRACGELTDKIFGGLDVSREILGVAARSLGDTLLVWDDAGLAGLAVCHFGAGTEAGSSTCYVKFGAARPGPRAEEDFGRLLGVCEELASRRGLARLAAGVSTARHEAYRVMQSRGFRTDLQGVAMHRPNEAGYSRPGVYLIDDWR